MNGAESIVHSLLKSGVDTCFANPGTSEMHFVAALDRIPGMRCVLGLFEGVVTGAADGYARIAGKPAAIVSASPRARRICRRRSRPETARVTHAVASSGNVSLSQHYSVAQDGCHPWHHRRDLFVAPHRRRGVGVDTGARDRIRQVRLSLEIGTAEEPDQLVELVDLLEAGGSIADVAHACGYTDQSAFARSFREHVGMSPSDYRRKHFTPYADDARSA